MVRILTCTALAVLTALPVAPRAQAGGPIKIWKVGSPYQAAPPRADMPAALARAAAQRGWSLKVEAFPAQGFADRFTAAAGDGTAPDLVVFDNFGVMDGARTPRGTFVGIGADPSVRSQLVQVTSSLDELLAPQRGWVFLFTASPNHAAARELALSAPRCTETASGETPPEDLAVAQIARAYLTGDSGSVLQYADDERLSGVASDPAVVTVGDVAACGGWGNERLAVVTVNAVYHADTKLGHVSLVFAFRKSGLRWQLLAAARDPVSTGEFANGLSTLSTMLGRDVSGGVVPTPAVLRSPENGRLPVPMKGARFGDFEWESSSSEDVVAEIAEFRYADDARLFLLRHPKPGARSRLSAGLLWSTRGGAWAWRVWSITRSGEISFSDVRTFVY